MSHNNKEVSVGVFLNQVLAVEKVRIKLFDQLDSFKMVSPYKYKKELGNLLTLSDLKNKRLDNYLGDIEYYFYGTDEKDMLSHSTKLYFVRETTNYALNPDSKHPSKSKGR